MKKYIYLIITLFTFSVSVYAQKQANTDPKAKFFVDDKEADILVAKLIDPSNYASIGIGGISASDMTKKTSTKKPTSLSMVTKPNAKFMNLSKFFARYNIPEANQQCIKVNGDLLVMREGFLANESRISKVELGEDGTGIAFINIIVK